MAVTIVVLLILAAITISFVLGEDGLINKAKEATNSMNNAVANDQASLNNLYNELNDIMNGIGGSGEGGDSNSETNTEPEPPEEIKPETESYVGYYADREGDGTVDGIIFADMAKGNTGDGEWSDSDGLYTIPVKDNLKEYTISKDMYTDDFGENYVITPKKGTTGNERFYIMALDDIDGKVTGTYYDWYNAAYDKMNDYATTTSEDFEAGETNTSTMIGKWDRKEYGEQDQCSDHKDMWGQIKNQVQTGWFVPSRAEWSAFAEELGITGENFVNHNLSAWYWSSSQYNTRRAWGAGLGIGCMNNGTVNGIYCVRLAATF